MPEETHECPYCGSLFTERREETLEEFRERVRKAMKERTGEPILC